MRRIIPVVGALIALACSENAGCRSGGGGPYTARGGALAITTWTGMCDASGAVALSSDVFVVADDEDNVLRAYDVRGGDTLWSVDVSPGLDLPGKARKKKKRKKKRKGAETDIEAATRVGDLALWLTSHGRSKGGKRKTERLRFFATTVAAGEMTVVGEPYERLLEDLLAEPSLAPFGLAEAATRAPKDPGGLNIEGMTARQEGGVWIGLRNPQPGGRALVIPLLNAVHLPYGARARFGPPQLLDLGGRGVRGLSWWRGQYLILAGHHDSGGESRLYTWDGKGAPAHASGIHFRGFNPEAFFTPDQRDRFLVLSDDGAIDLGGDECKRLKRAADKRFRGVWLSL